MRLRPAAPKGTRAADLASLRRRQRGGFALGLIVGVLIGLALSLAVALYVTNVPVPFINKVPQRSAEQEASQVEKNRTWEPNAPLSGKGAQRAPGAASSVQATPAVVPPPAPGPVAAVPSPAAAAAAKPAASAPEAVTYFVQAGAFLNSDDAEQQRASLALLGLSAKITERDQAGRMMYRVRVGPFERKAEADATKEKLAGSGIEAALVRVQQR